MKVNPNLHPSASSPSTTTTPDTKTLLSIENDIFDRCIEKGFLVARGSWFLAEQQQPDGGNNNGGGALGPDLFFRATFASASDSQMDEAIRRFGEAVRESFGI